MRRSDRKKRNIRMRVDSGSQGVVNLKKIWIALSKKTVRISITSQSSRNKNRSN